MGFFKKLFQGDWSNPFDNVVSGAKNVTESMWNDTISNGPERLKQLAAVGGVMSSGWDKLWSIAPSALDFWSSERANAANAQSVADQMRFQEMMSNTAYQRAMADMARSGLNPMLAYQQGGASTPGGASYRANVPTPGQTWNNTRMMESSRQLQAAQGAQAQASARQADSSVPLNSALAQKALQDARTSLADELQKQQATRVGREQESQIRAQIKLLDAQSRMTAEQVGYWSARAGTELQNQRIAELNAMMEEFKKAGADVGSGFLKQLKDWMKSRGMDGWSDVDRSGVIPREFLRGPK